MRKEPIIEGEYYHILNRGNNKQLIFRDERDRIKFLFSILYFQSPVKLDNISRQVNYFVKNNSFKMPEDVVQEIINKRYVELIAFSLMPNHFHLILHELKEGGISNYMLRILGSYTKYINTKNEISGHLFQGTFKSVHIKDDPQLLYTSAYIHNNVKELRGWNGKEHLCPWSSFQDYVNENRWGELLKTDIILDQFSNKDKEKYKSFVQKSGAKDKSEPT
ncbi:transposase [Patescibacteria group bacterium]|nr:transposase [Patescibacteria group bacterium]